MATGSAEKSAWARSPLVFALYILLVIAVILTQGFRHDWGWAVLWAIVLGVGVYRFWRWRQGEPNLPSR